jgi:RNA polymerase sigma factor (sigma-70 family)
LRGSAHLLRDVAWLRRLARHLAGDPATADDLAADAVLAWAGAAAPPLSVRGWLATVVRHRAARVHRRALLRQRSERAAARDEALPAVDEAIARTELHRAVVDAVLALRESYRAAVVLRYLDDLPLAEVAAR